MEPVKVIILNGSPNEKGNTWQLLDRLSGELTKMGVAVELVQVPAVLTASNCYYCTACTTPCQGICYAGTPLEDLYQRMAQADGLVLASPVYFGTVSAQLKAFFDMTRKLRTDKGLLNTVSAAVSVGAARFGGQETTLRALHDIMFVEGMLIIGDGHVEHDCGHHGVCASKPAEQDTAAANRITVLAKRLVEVCASTKGIRKR